MWPWWVVKLDPHVNGGLNCDRWAPHCWNCWLVTGPIINLGHPNGPALSKQVNTFESKSTCYRHGNDLIKACSSLIVCWSMIFPSLFTPPFKILKSWTTGSRRLITVALKMDGLEEKKEKTSGLVSNQDIQFYHFVTHYRTYISGSWSNNCWIINNN